MELAGWELAVGGVVSMVGHWCGAPCGVSAAVCRTSSSENSSRLVRDARFDCNSKNAP